MKNDSKADIVNRISFIISLYFKIKVPTRMTAMISARTDTRHPEDDLVGDGADGLGSAILPLPAQTVQTPLPKESCPPPVRQVLQSHFVEPPQCGHRIVGPLSSVTSPFPAQTRHRPLPKLSPWPLPQVLQSHFVEPPQCGHRCVAICYDLGLCTSDGEQKNLRYRESMEEPA